MPLYANAIGLIRENLEQLAAGRRVRAVAIGTLTDAQLSDINQSRTMRRNPLPPISAEVLFIGQHIYNSRILRDGYCIDDLIDQIVSAMDELSSFIPTSKMAAIQNQVGRKDRFGRFVRDKAIFECSARHPRPELFSVEPKGDIPPARMKSLPEV